MSKAGLKAFFSLGENENKVSTKLEEQTEGIASNLLDELDIDTPDEELLILKKRWIQAWTPYETRIVKRQKRNEKYWKGLQDGAFIAPIEPNRLATTPTGVADEEGTEHHLLNDNLIYEALETFLPQATRRNPDPVVSSDNTEEGRKLCDDIRKSLVYLADVTRLKLKIKEVTRDWALYFLGVGKVGWDFENNEVSFVKIRPQRMILDPEATILPGGIYNGNYLGEYRKDSASNLIKRFPDKETYIKTESKGYLSTQLRYIEWWGDDGRILFWTLKDEVLKKMKNPNFNYDTEEDDIDEEGELVINSITGKNHLPIPQNPYVFLSIFQLGLHPHDDTGLIEQNIALQDLINKRYRQIDNNVDGMNGGWAISGERSGMTKEQASEVIRAFRNGDGVWVPRGNVNEAISRMMGSGLPADCFNQLFDARDRLRSIFGVQGSTPQGTESDKTVRGKIIRAGQDQSRTGGGITEYIEQFADRIYNLWVQMMYVYYDEPHVMSIIGQENAFEEVTILNSEIDRKLTVSVKDGSMIPKDPLSERNEAIDLWNANAIDPVELFTRLDFPNPREAAKNLVQFQANPLAMFPDVTPPPPEPEAQPNKPKVE